MSAIGMLVVGAFDYEISHWLRSLGWKAFADFMDRSIFEGEGFGGSDIGVIFQIAALFVYLWIEWLNKRQKLMSLRPHFGLFVFTSLTAGLLLVHTTKFVLGRARPYMVDGTGRIPFTEWYEVGPLFFVGKWSAGSFPSGHTASIVLLLGVAYVILFRFGRETRRPLAYLIGTTILCFSVAMALARVISFQHWLSDTFASIFLGWLMIHISYFWILFIPQQERVMVGMMGYPDLPKFWEFRLFGWLLLVAIGITASVFGYRFFGREQIFLPAFALLAGVFLCGWGIWKFYLSRQKIKNHLNRELVFQ